jgi:exosortase A
VGPLIGLAAGRLVTARGAASASRHRLPSRNPYVVLGCCLASLAVLYAPTIVSILKTWSQDPFGHGYFVPAGVAYLAWSRHERIAPTDLRPAVGALALVGFLSSMWLASNLTGIGLIQQFCLVAMFAAVTWAVLGAAAARALAFPLGLLFFALPFGDMLAANLQVFTARFALGALTLSGVHPVLEGTVIAIADTRWRVTEGCGGINYLVASLAVGYLYAGVVYRQWGHRLMFVVASAVVPLVANGLRVYTTILLDHLGATRVAAGMGHYLYGLLVFGLVMSVLFITCGRWREEPSSNDRPEPGSERANGVVSQAAAGRTVVCATIAVLLAAIGPVAAWAIALPLGSDRAIRYSPPSVALPWEKTGEDLLPWTPRFMAPRAEFLETFRSGGQVVKLYVADYGANQPNAMLASRSNLLFDELWRLEGERRRTIVWNGQSFQVTERLLRSAQSSLVVWNWYQIGDRTTANRYVAKLRLAMARALRSREGSAAFAVATEEQPGVDAAAVLAAFVGQISRSHPAVADPSEGT